MPSRIDYITTQQRHNAAEARWHRQHLTADYLDRLLDRMRTIISKARRRTACPAANREITRADKALQEIERFAAAGDWEQCVWECLPMLAAAKECYYMACHDVSNIRKRDNAVRLANRGQLVALAIKKLAFCESLTASSLVDAPPAFRYNAPSRKDG